ncbi:toxin glutamine deamidase domain-containing protein [Streptomyces halobius]|uniref:Papain fold toxin 1 (Glutamine deamidase) of polymorphic toxin system n=1 Tax=Streptomyces halobius TaxID=2879846 RepID=A0ABY4MGN2_9ACTN|nr:toxin glutamine deamidase domain-containing protein [Streptomyces halobius]UQA95491.1 hypothetical protein K9S39_29795 [Streptomyces halobius]
MLPNSVEWVLEMLGFNWPTADEDKLIECAQVWRQFAAEVEGHQSRGATYAANVLGANAGDSVEGFSKAWEKFSGGSGYFDDAAQAAEVIAFTFEAAAALVIGMKIAVITQLVILAAEIIAAQAAAPFTLGLSEIGGAAATLATREVVRRILKEVAKQLLDAIMEAAKEPVISALEAMASDLIAQTVNQNFGAQNGYDLGRTAKEGQKAATDAIKNTGETLGESLRDGAGSRAGRRARGGLESAAGHGSDGADGGDGADGAGSGDSGGSGSNTSSSDGGSSSSNGGSSNGGSSTSGGGSSAGDGGSSSGSGSSSSNDSGSSSDGGGSGSTSNDSSSSNSSSGGGRSGSDSGGSTSHTPRASDNAGTSTNPTGTSSKPSPDSPANSPDSTPDTPRAEPLPPPEQRSPFDEGYQGGNDSPYGTPNTPDSGSTPESGGTPDGSPSPDTSRPDPDSISTQPAPDTTPDAARPAPDTISTQPAPDNTPDSARPNPDTISTQPAPDNTPGARPAPEPISTQPTPDQSPHQGGTSHPDTPQSPTPTPAPAPEPAPAPAPEPTPSALTDPVAGNPPSYGDPTPSNAPHDGTGNGDNSATGSGGRTSMPHVGGTAPQGAPVHHTPSANQPIGQRDPAPGDPMPTVRDENDTTVTTQSADTMTAPPPTQRAADPTSTPSPAPQQAQPSNTPQANGPMTGAMPPQGGGPGTTTPGGTPANGSGNPSARPNRRPDGSQAVRDVTQQPTPERPAYNPRLDGPRRDAPTSPPGNDRRPDGSQTVQDHTQRTSPHSPPHNPRLDGPARSDNSQPETPDTPRPDSPRQADSNRPPQPPAHPSSDTTHPDTNRPDGDRPDTTRPEATQHNPTRPDAARSDSPTRPDAPQQPAPTRADRLQSDATNQAPSDPGTQAPAAPNPNSPHPHQQSNQHQHQQSQRPQQQPQHHSQPTLQSHTPTQQQTPQQTPQQHPQHQSQQQPIQQQPVPHQQPAPHHPDANQTQPLPHQQQQQQAPVPQPSNLRSHTDVRIGLNVQPNGLYSPFPHDQQALEASFPRYPDGTPRAFNDPFQPWAQLQNDGGHTVLGRSNNCADCTRSFMESWYGNPQVSAVRTYDPDGKGGIDRASGEREGTRNIEEYTGAKFRNSGPNSKDGYHQIADDLRKAGPGAAAAVLVTWPDKPNGDPGGAHVFNAVNHNGKVVWVDSQTGKVSEQPINTAAKNVWHLVLDADRKPFDPTTAQNQTPQQQTPQNQQQANTQQNQQQAQAQAQQQAQAQAQHAQPHPQQQQQPSPYTQQQQQQQQPGPYQQPHPQQPGPYAQQPHQQQPGPYTQQPHQQPQTRNPHQQQAPHHPQNPQHPAAAPETGDSSPTLDAERPDDHIEPDATDTTPRPDDANRAPRPEESAEGNEAPSAHKDGPGANHDESDNKDRSDHADHSNRTDQDDQRDKAEHPPASETRNRERPGGLEGPTDQHQQHVENNVPKDDNGTPEHAPAPAHWADTINNPGPDAPGRNNNCVDAALAAADTYAGNPTAAAHRTPDTNPDGTPSDHGETNGRNRIENTLGARFNDYGNGPNAFNRLENTLRNNGHGSQAVIVTQDNNGRAHAWNVVNHNGTITYVDAQTGQRSNKPLHDGTNGVHAIPLDANRHPLNDHPTGGKSTDDHATENNRRPAAEPAGATGDGSKFDQERTRGSAQFGETQDGDQRHYGQLGEDSQRRLRESHDVRQVGLEGALTPLRAWANDGSLYRAAEEAHANGKITFNRLRQLLKGFDELDEGTQLAVIGGIGRLSSAYHGAHAVGESPVSMDPGRTKAAAPEGTSSKPGHALHESHVVGGQGPSADARAYAVRQEAGGKNATDSAVEKIDNDFLDLRSRHGQGVLQPDMSGKNYAVLMMEERDKDGNLVDIHYVIDSSIPGSSEHHHDHSEPHLGEWARQVEEKHGDRFKAVRMYTEFEPCGDKTGTGGANCSDYLTHEMDRDTDGRARSNRARIKRGLAVPEGQPKNPLIVDYGIGYRKGPTDGEVGPRANLAEAEQKVNEAKSAVEKSKQEGSDTLKEDRARLREAREELKEAKQMEAAARAAGNPDRARVKEEFDRDMSQYRGELLRIWMAAARAKDAGVVPPQTTP